MEPIRCGVMELYGDVIHAHMMPDYYIHNHFFWNSVMPKQTNVTDSNYGLPIWGLIWRTR